MNKLWDAILWIFIVPGDWVSDRLAVSKDENRGLVRMLVNSLFWIFVAIIALAIWTSRMPEFQ